MKEKKFNSFKDWIDDMYKRKRSKNSAISEKGESDIDSLWKVFSSNLEKEWSKNAEDNDE